MIRLQATIWKELLLLRRDRAGILVLFLMPAILVVVITMVQQNVLEMMGETGTSILLVDQDGYGVGELLEKRLAEEGQIRLIDRLGDQDLERTQAIDVVADGEYQLCLVIPNGTGQAVTKQAERLVRGGGDRRQCN